MDSKQARTVLITMNVVLGVVFLLFPRLAMRMYGIDPDQNRGAAYPCRYLGANSLLVAGMLAAILPARRAARLDVLEALQYE
jgi:hypothetical protein